MKHLAQLFLLVEMNYSSEQNFLQKIKWKKTDEEIGLFLGQNTVYENLSQEFVKSVFCNFKS